MNRSEAALDATSHGGGLGRAEGGEPGQRCRWAKDLIGSATFVIVVSVADRAEYIICLRRYRRLARVVEVDAGGVAPATSRTGTLSRIQVVIATPARRASTAPRPRECRRVRCRRSAAPARGGLLLAAAATSVAARADRRSHSPGDRPGPRFEPAQVLLYGHMYIRVSR